MHKKTMLILGITLGLLCGCIQQDVSDKEKTLLITIEDLEEYDIKYSNEYKGDYLKRSYKEGSWEVNYEYDPPDNPNITTLYLTSTVEFEKNTDEAKDTYNQGLLMYKGGALLSDGVLEEQPDFINLGDETFIGFLKKDNAIIGNLVVIRRENKIHNLLISGLYFEDKSQLEELLTPKLLIMDKYEN